MGSWKIGLIKRLKSKTEFTLEINEYVEASVMETNRPKSVKHEMRGRKLKSVVYWQGASKQKGVKQVARKTRTISSLLHVPVALYPEKKEPHCLRNRRLGGP